MSNRFQVLYKSNEGVELDTWLRQESKTFPPKSNLESLNNMRVFYVVQAALDKDDSIYKIGISERGGHSAKGRLIDYVYSYGVATKDNPCKGVKLFLLLANYFNPDVEAANAYVRQLETRVKAHFKSQNQVARGAERIRVPLTTLFRYLERTNNLFEDKEIVTRQTPRLQEKGQAANEAVKAIKEHYPDKTFLVSFMSGFKYDANERQVPYTRPDAKMTYEEIIQHPRGKTLLDEYIKKNNIDMNLEPSLRPRNLFPETPRRPVTRSQGNFNVTTLPTDTQTPPPVINRPVTRSRTRNYTTTTI